jgi:hypothetical protein
MHCLIRVPHQIWHAVRRHLLASSCERMAYLLARASTWTDPWGQPTTDLLVRQALLIPDAALRLQAPTRVEVDPGFTGQVLRACYETGLSLIDVHTHPFSDGPVRFSAQDRDNMLLTHTEFAARIPQDPPALAASLVLGPGGLAGAWSPPPGSALHTIEVFRLIGPTVCEVPLCAP